MFSLQPDHLLGPGDGRRGVQLLGRGVSKAPISTRLLLAGQGCGHRHVPHWPFSGRLLLVAWMDLGSRQQLGEHPEKVSQCVSNTVTSG